MASSYMEFNAPDVEGSPPRFSLIKQKHTIVIRLMGQVFCRLLFHLLAAHILNMSDTASLPNFMAT